MRLRDSDLLKYVSGQLALPGDQRDEHRLQVGRLIEKLDSKIREDGSYRIARFRRAGSLEKGTSNRPSAGKAVDADVGVYFDVDDATDFDIAELQRLIKKLLAAAYPQKSEDDFDDSRDRTFGVVFQGSGLEVDLAPIVSLDDEADYGVQYSRRGDPVETSVKAHLTFYREHAKSDPLLAPILRLSKRWRNWQELTGIQSFHLELLLSYLIDIDGPAAGVEEGFRRLFRFLAHGLKEPVVWDGMAASFADAVVVLDPANAHNNVARRIEPAERDALVAGARAAYETLTWAQGLPEKGETIDAWRELLGPGFGIGE